MLISFLFCGGMSRVIVPFFGLVFFGCVDGVFGDDSACFAVDGDGVVGVDECDDSLFAVVPSDVEFA